MRRSGAPSQRGFQPPLKKPNPTPDPVLTNLPPNTNESGDGLAKSDMEFLAELGITLTQNSQSSQDGLEPPQQTSTLGAAIESASGTFSLSNDENQCPNTKKPKFKPVFRTSSAAATKPRSSQATSCKQADDGESEQNGVGAKGPVDKSYYYSVMWCKLSKKKHKKWEGDAVLVVRGRSAILQDLEGKDIGRSSGYKLSELATLTEGQTLIIGGKEIEVMGAVTESDYASGKCFTSASSSGPATVMELPSRPVAAPKPFVKPQKDKSEISQSVSVAVQPRHDPDHPESVVMPRPPQSVLLEHTHANLPVVDVVVDPYLTRHLRPHQKLGVAFLYECVLGFRQYNGLGAILADEMGLGKTLQCITLIWTLLKQGPYGGRPVIRRSIIVTPGSLVKNWRSEFRKWLGDERISVYAVGQDKKIDDYLLSKLYPILIISYEMFVKLYHNCLKDVRFDLIVCDEGHRLKNSNIKTTALISSLACRRRIVLSGTPVQNDLQEYYSIVDFCNPGVLGTPSSFHRVYELPILASRQPDAAHDDVTLGESRGAELARLTDLFILRRSSDINNEYLPPKTEIVLFCRPSELQLTIYRALLTSRVFRECLLSNGTTETGPLVCIDALKKLSNHPALLYQRAVDEGASVQETEGSLYRSLLSLYPDDFSSTREASKHSGKLMVLERLLDEIHEGGERVVLVSNYTKTLSIIQSLCERKQYKFHRLDGQTPTSKRQELVQRFNSKYSDISVFLLSSKAGGTGLNLVGASRLILYDIDWNPATDLQAMARVWRDGQRRHVRIYRLLTTGTIEEKIYQRQISKQGLSGAVVGNVELASRNVHFSQEDLKDLFTLRENCSSDTHDLLSCRCNGNGTKTDDISCYGESNGTIEVDRGKDFGRNQKNLTMVELLAWQHADGCHLDEIVDNPASYEDIVTYAFWNVNNNMRTAVLDKS